MSAREGTRIKICGITRLEDAQAVVEAGADALGLNFSAQSARQVDTGVAAQIAKSCAGHLLRVGLFVDPDPRDVQRVLERVELDVLQLHGAESGEYCAALSEQTGKPYMKAHRIAGTVDARALAAEFPGACCQLLDAYVPGQPGGTGQSFDWELWPRNSGLKLVLAGGLSATNVQEAILATRPFAVDLSGGVEGTVKGIKDAVKIRAFVSAVREADRQIASATG